MWAFDVIASEFYRYQSDIKDERNIRQKQQHAQEKMKRG